jgi:hypothetical protein
MTRDTSGGAAAGDYDRDGWLDLYVVRGDIGANLLFHNRGDGTFAEVAATAGVAGAPTRGNGPIFVDLDGDAWPDLLVGGIEGSAPAAYRNLHDGTFASVANGAGLTHGQPQYSMALGDVDHDGDLDLAATHWAQDQRVTLWQNDGTGVFSNATFLAGLDGTQTYGFTPIFADVTDDGWLDLLVAGDFGSSRVFHNAGDGTFTRSVDPVITDENGMGASVIDYDRDGDLDWFVSSIWDPNGVAEGNWGVTGNRLYRNKGNGTFEDVTTAAGVRQGYWGWGSCFADFDNDGHPDLFHVNGFTIDQADEYYADPSRLFVARGDGTFAERSAELGIADTGQGRGVVCFDYDRDGDIDLLISNNGQALRLYRNDGGNEGSYLTVSLAGLPPNTGGIGARVFASARGGTQMREIRAGNNFESADPPVAHFGLGKSRSVRKLLVEWPDGSVTVRRNVAARQHLMITQLAPPPVPATGPVGAGATAGALLFLALRRLRKSSTSKTRPL